MVLVDTSVWVNHLRSRSRPLAYLLEEGSVFTHPFVIGEIACGNLKNRKEILSSLETLPKVETAQDEEVMKFIDSHRLFGLGIGLVDVHLLISTLLTDASLWTMDKNLLRVADRFHILTDISLSRP